MLTAALSIASQAEFNEFNFGHNVAAESERVLQGLIRGGTVA